MKYHSQDGQDKFLLEEYFNDKNYRGTYIDIGAHDGITLSNTKCLEDRGWNGICFEPIPKIFDQLIENRKCKAFNVAISDKNENIEFLVIDGYSEMLSGILNNYDPRHIERIDREINHFGGNKKIISVESKKFSDIVPFHTIDYVSIDVEGSEMSILNSIDFDKHDIRLFSIENNYNDEKIINFMRSKKYTHIKTLGGDYFFEKKLKTSISIPTSKSEKNPKISIAIPTWETYGKGAEFLDDLLRTIEIQTFKDYEVCISDHSEDNQIFDKVSEFEDRINFCYEKNKNDKGNGPANTNRAIDMCSGEIIKVMFQDDFFYDDEALEKIYNELHNSKKVWLLNGCNHTADHGHSFYWDLYPRFNDKLLDGVNTLSSPSALSFKKEVKNRFDINLVHFMDIDFFYGMKETYGDPIFYDDVLVTNRFPNDLSISSNAPKDFSKESKYCKEKYGVKL